MRRSEEVAEWVVQQVDEGGCVQVGITHHLRGEQGLSGATAEKATHHAVAHVHVVCHFLHGKGETRRHPWRLAKGFSNVIMGVSCVNEQPHQVSSYVGGKEKRKKKKEDGIRNTVNFGTDNEGVSGGKHADRPLGAI